MKKTMIIGTLFIASVFLFLISYNFNRKLYPKLYYNVYLDGQLIGTIGSKDELKNYINERTNHIINAILETKEYCPLDENDELLKNAENIEYYQKDDQNCAKVTTKIGTNIDRVYNPTGLKVEENLTYRGEITKIEDIYNKIVEQKSFTVKGYQFTIKGDDKSSYIYVLDKSIFEKATTELIKTYVGEESYLAYLNNSQEEIKSTGTYLNNVYIQENITVKEKQVSINEKIYTDYKALSQFLLFGEESKTSTYVVKENEMISDIAFNNKISVQEFLISNNKYKDSKSLIASGTNVQIKETNPQMKVVVESYVVEDKANDYKTIYQYDNTKYIGYNNTVQKGQKGLERVQQAIQTINGVTIYVEPKGKETLKASIDEIIVKGDKLVPSIGDVGNWAWPSESGWTISDDYMWRTHPISRVRQFHNALDIAGTGYGSKVYSANNGTILTREYDPSYGYYIVINHNNGYYTLYAHMSKFMEGLNIGSVVSRGQVIGYVGSTGSSTGPHIHFEVWKNCKRCHISPWALYR